MHRGPDGELPDDYDALDRKMYGGTTKLAILVIGTLAVGIAIVAVLISVSR